MQIDRKEFLEEIKAEEVLRENIRKAIHIVKARKGQKLQEELKLRTIIRKLLAEQEEDEKVGKYSTGINELEALLKKIVPQLEDDYKILTTDPDQRQSFRAHILHAVKNTIGTIAPDGVPAAAEGGEFEGLAEVLTLKENILLNILSEEIEVEVDDDVIDEAPPEGFIDIDPEETEEVEEDTFGITGMDATGAKIAERSWAKVEKSIKDSFSLLDNEKDKKEFYDYLITNLKLYFDKFEDEMAANLEEPTTPEYEQEKQDQEALDTEEGGEELGGEEEEFGTEEEFPAEEEEEEPLEGEEEELAGI